MGFASWLRERWRLDAEAAKADPRDLLLAAVPVIVGVVGASLLFPRAVVPLRIPLPVPDAQVLAAEVRAEAQRATKSVGEPLSAPVREVGGAFRSWNLLAFRDDDSVVHDAHLQAMHLGALARGVREREGADGLLALRAVEMSAFLTELHRFEASNEETSELRELGGNVIARMRDVGFIEGHRLVVSSTSWHVLYKLLWNRSVGLADDPLFALSLDDEREMARLQLAYPHPSEVERLEVASERSRAKTGEACEAIAKREADAADRWRLQKVDAWAVRDPSYPRDFARGVLLFRLGRYPESARSFQASREAGGAYAQRAFFHERAALVASAVE